MKKFVVLCLNKNLFFFWIFKMVLWWLVRLPISPRRRSNFYTAIKKSIFSSSWTLVSCWLAIFASRPLDFHWLVDATSMCIYKCSQIFVVYCREKEKSFWILVNVQQWFIRKLQLKLILQHVKTLNDGKTANTRAHKRTILEIQKPVKVFYYLWLLILVKISEFYLVTQSLRVY